MSVTLTLDDEHLAENAEAIQYLKQLGLYTDEELQKLYDRQVAKDRGEE